MNEPSERFWQLFFEVYENLPRQGPGNKASAAQALALCADLPPEPRVVDLGCGVGAQTLYLAELTLGPIVALDSHAPSIERLQTSVDSLGLGDRVRPVVGDMAQPNVPASSFDLIWSEGALYNLGIETALKMCRELLKPHGYLVFTEAIWRKENPPAEVKASFDLDYPTMGNLASVLAAIERSGLALVGNFTLPDEAWWDDFYTPMESRIAEMRLNYAGDVEACAILDQLANEPEMHRRYSDYYAYEFFVVRLPRS